MVIGNSSSGIIEAPYFNLPTINIGDRQKGRVLPLSVISCNTNPKSILKAIKLANDQTVLKEIRKKIYDEAINSPLFESKKFNNDFYNLLETLKVRKNG